MRCMSIVDDRQLMPWCKNYTFLVRGRNSPTVGALHDVGHHRLSGVWVGRSHQDAARGVAEEGVGMDVAGTGCMDVAASLPSVIVCHRSSKGCHHQPLGVCR
jgi:hypothetical protein